MENSYGSEIPHTPNVQPKNWLVESILATIFCCLPFGIAGIVFASQVNSKWVAGDHAGALEASRQAAKWTKISFLVSIAGFIFALIFVFFFGGMAFLGSLGVMGVNG
ncbi:CD225/dispanin family protein [Segetibacter sp. 3557_3]|uniref:CD225/dispanin family protein n=1 Tax=Segetibacter sp. 3557_3 TaxID=2547429 RepID=UPI0010590DAE|nr:CD225/dispanin family protein [Segetibacter sp. 3557_3]TDH28762.1 CD225/dispanin family protein [Segetibacter sp. 3557_3]